MSKVVWNNETHLIMETAETDGVFVKEGAYQIYERIPGTDDWNRLPDYKTTGSIVWYETLEAAREALPNNQSPKLATDNDAKSVVGGGEDGA